VELDERQEKIGYKIRGAQLQKVPYMLVTGDRESADGTVSVRSRTGGDLGPRDVDEFLRDALDESARKDPGTAHVPKMETARAAEA
jgi:threonyl-tRNA synthetase